MNAALSGKIKIINENLGNLKKNFNVKEIALFGSYAKGKQTKKSDIDILVEFKKPIGFFKFVEVGEGFNW